MVEIIMQACPRCGVGKDMPCLTPKGLYASRIHRERPYEITGVDSGVFGPPVSPEDRRAMLEEILNTTAGWYGAV